jgi:hypothetical protein
MTNRRGEAILTDRNRTTGPERKGNAEDEYERLKKYKSLV